MRADDVQFGTGDVRLSGTVWVPDQAAFGTPGVVLVGGSGPADRTNDGYFDALRDHLVAAGAEVTSAAVPVEGLAEAGLSSKERSSVSRDLRTASVSLNTSSASGS